MTAAMITTMVLCFALTISVAVSIGLAALVGIQVSNVNMLISVKEMFSSINKFPLAAIPFYILAGNVMETGQSHPGWQKRRDTIPRVRRESSTRGPPKAQCRLIAAV